MMVGPPQHRLVFLKALVTFQLALRMLEGRSPEDDAIDATYLREAQPVMDRLGWIIDAIITPVSLMERHL